LKKAALGDGDVAQVTLLGIALGTVPGTVREVVLGGISKGVFPAIPRAISSAILAAIWTFNSTVILNATGELVCGQTVLAIRTSRCGATFGMSCDAVCTVVSMVIWMGTP
jgi:hypothetical protein